MDSLVESLRIHTREEHHKTEMLVDIPQLLRGELSQVHYYALLRTHYRIIQDVLYKDRSDNHVDFFSNEMVFLKNCQQHLAIDLEKLEVNNFGPKHILNTTDGSAPPPDSSRTKAKSLSILTGELYVTLGATQGAKHIYTALNRYVRKHDASINYYLYCKEQPPTLWPSFLRKVSVNAHPPIDPGVAVKAAQDKFYRFRCLFKHFSFCS